MKKVWRMVVTLNAEDKLVFIGPEEIDIDEKTYSFYNWDRIVRIDSVVNSAILILSLSKDALDGVGVGWHLHKDTHSEEVFKAFLQNAQNLIDERSKNEILQDNTSC